MEIIPRSQGFEPREQFQYFQVVEGVALQSFGYHRLGFPEKEDGTFPLKMCECKVKGCNGI